jgi:type IV pilus assembly protein PilB
VVDRWKLLADADLSVRQLPQEGRILVTQGEHDFDLRVTFVPTVLGERTTARILAKSGWTLTLDQLHFTDPQFATVRSLIRQPNGLIVAAGPDGSGKTATLYGMLLDIQAEQQGRANLMTVEEPAEFVLDGISQIPVNRRIGLTYPVALRAVLKSDLDVVMIGDLPDAETTELALHLAATGHLVMAPITANHTLHALQRLRERVDPIMLAQTLIGITSQRLVRRICTNCVTEYEPSSLALQRAGLTPADTPSRRGAGCEACRMTGFKGRTALYEVLSIDNRLGGLIAEEASLERLWQETFGRNGGSLWDAARAKVRQGLTTVEEAIRVLFDYRPPGSEAPAKPEAPTTQAP